MKLLLRLLRPVRYRSAIQCDSASYPGVSFAIRRVSLGGRIELAKDIRELSTELEFHQAGESAKDQVEAAILSARIDLVYLRWGLLAISGIEIDGELPAVDALYSRGPERLLREIVDRIKGECGLTDDERKN
jgi:hypothetical protein